MSVAVCALLLASVTLLSAQTLRGSRAAVDRMYRQAHAEGLHFYQTSDGVRRAATRGSLVRLRDSETYVVHNVRYPYVRPAVALFVERLSAQYKQACGERLVVTSAIRPLYYQRRLANGSDRSVHPTGMAVDLRRPTNGRCLSWLRRVLLDLDRAGVIEAIEERRPPHFHVAVFPTPYQRYVERRGSGTVRLASATPAEAAPAAAPAPAGTYVVRRGDSLWKIASRHRVSVDDLQAANGLGTSRLQPGQKLRIPGTGELAAGGESGASGGAAATYRVRRGDTLWTIARRHRSTVDEIKRLNAITSNRLLPGQELTIPVR